MAKQTFTPNPRVAQIFDDLDAYLTFCQDYGYRFDESTLGDMRDYAYRQHVKQITGKFPRDQWAEAERNFNRR